eukprot:TRINITY_DN7904_c0_g1_i1.p1 TRINITY_DN7904_c0_g1~~TRINITY_DN7904_c0_g1_i1.p1  ORF type:complete len:182 (+),score=25.57 TRINITY_DN7904_c0_g1_i1:513-1058(+)
MQHAGLSRSSNLPADASCSSLLSVPTLRYGDLRQLIRYGAGGKEVTTSTQKSSGPETCVDMQPHSAFAAGEAEAASATAAGHSCGELRWRPTRATGGLAPGVQQSKGGALACGPGQQSPQVGFSSSADVPQGLSSDHRDCRLNHESFPQITWKPSLARTWTPRTLPSPCRSQQPIGSGTSF